MCQFCILGLIQLLWFEILVELIALLAGGGISMIHFSCDGCGKILEDSGEDIRYKVKIETYIANDTEDDGSFENDDILNNAFDYDDDDDSINDELEEIEYRTFQFDLCPACYKNYLQNPLSSKTLPKKRFSEN